MRIELPPAAVGHFAAQIKIPGQQHPLEVDSTAADNDRKANTRRIEDTTATAGTIVVGVGGVVSHGHVAEAGRRPKVVVEDAAAALACRIAADRAIAEGDYPLGEFLVEVVNSAAGGGCRIAVDTAGGDGQDTGAVQDTAAFCAAAIVTDGAASQTQPAFIVDNSPTAVRDSVIATVTAGAVAAEGDVGKGTVPVLWLKMAPPLSAWFSSNVVPLTVSAPWLSMAPPVLVACPLESEALF